MLVAVYGPRPARSIRHEDPHRSTLEVVVLPASGPAGACARCRAHARLAAPQRRASQGPGSRRAPHPRPTTAGKAEADLELALHSIFDPVIVSAAHPRTVVSVHAQVVHDDGSLLPALINCVSLGLVDAGVPLDGIVSSVSCSAQPPGSSGSGGTALDLLLSEEAACTLAGAYAFKGAGGAAGPVFVRQSGRGTWAQTRALVEDAAHASNTVLAFLRLAIQRKLARDAVSFGGADAPAPVAEPVR